MKSVQVFFLGAFLGLGVIILMYCLGEIDHRGDPANYFAWAAIASGIIAVNLTILSKRVLLYLLFLYHTRNETKRYLQP